MSVWMAVTTLLCRGVYGYAILLIGMGATGLTYLFRTRAVIVALLLITPIYAAVRYTGMWEGGAMLRLAEAVQPQRVGSLEFRLLAEREHIDLVNRHNPLFGFGEVARPVQRWPDGRWVTELGMSGLIGVGLWLLAQHLTAIGLFLKRRGGVSIDDAGWALAMFLALLLVNSAHNRTYMSVTPLICGALVGYAIAVRRATMSATDRKERTSCDRSSASYLHAFSPTEPRHGKASSSTGAKRSGKIASSRTTRP